METYFNNDINISNRFFFIMGYTHDWFCDNSLLRVGMEQTLHRHLCENGYERIIYFKRGYGIYCYDKKSFELLKKTSKNDDSASMKKPVIMAGPLGKNKATQNTETLHLGKVNDIEVTDQIKTCMKNEKIKTAIVFADANDFIRNFGKDIIVHTRDGQRQREDISNIISGMLNEYRGGSLSPDNENIIIFIFPTGSPSDVISRYNNHELLWKDFFAERIGKTNTIIIGTPAAGEIRNTINHYRIRHGLKTDFSQLDKMCNKIARACCANKMDLYNFMKYLRKLSSKNGILNMEKYDEIIGKKQDDQTAMEKLKEMIGMDNVKSEFEELFAVLNASSTKPGINEEFKSRLLPQSKSNQQSTHFLHYILTGNPGTGKTTVAHLLGEIYYETGFLESGHTVKVTRADLVAGYIGQTELKTKAKIEEAMGGVLFIDEAYSLARGGENDFGQQAIDTLIEAMEDRRGQFAVIFAGYPDEIELLNKKNSGFLSRCNKLHINDYSPSELLEIFNNSIKKQNFTIGKTLENVIKIFFENWYNARNIKEWGNAREIIKLIDRMYRKWSARKNREKTSDDAAIFEIDDIPPELRDFCNQPTVAQKTVFEKIPRTKLRGKINPNERITDSLLLIKTEGKDGAEVYGSGFIITEDGYAVTCYHVIKDVKSFKVRIRIPDRIGGIDSWHDASVAATNEKIDIALIKIEGENFPAIKLQKPDDKSNIGEDIYLIGYPFGTLISDEIKKLNSSRFDGKISSLQENDGYDIILLDCQAKRGNSGGCVISKKTNEVIAVFRGSLIDGDELIEEINYATPIKYVWQEFIK